MTITSNNTQEHQTRRDYGFAFGLMAGTCVGAGLVMWLAPKAASELRKRMTASATSLGERASARYQEASTRVGVAVDELTRKGEDVRDEVAASVARGAQEVARKAHEVERVAKSTMSERR